MAFDKAKVLRAAEKDLAQGKISAAIKEYRQIVENDRDDFTALNMLGDLYARNGKKPEAISCFIRIAEHYREQGFNLKAIAMYKKIDKLQPSDPAIANTLGALYEMQGLVVDARGQYMVVAEAFQREGQPLKALEVFRKIANLEPQNTDIRLRLAQGYLRENLKKESADAFAEAGEQFFARRNFLRALEAFGETLKLAPRNRVALNGILAAHIALGTADEAAEILEQASASAPEDIELLSMLARAYIEAEDPVKAEAATEALVEAEDSNYSRFLDVSALFLKEDHPQEAVRILSSYADQILSAGEIEVLMKQLDEILARNPDHIDGLRLLTRVHRWQCDDSKTKAALERLIEAAEALGQTDTERTALAQLVQIVPDVRYLDRLEALGGPPADMRVEPPAPVTQQAPESASTFERFAVANEEAAAYSPNATEDALVGGVSEFEWNSVAQDSVAEIRPDASTSFADLNEDEAVFETNNADSAIFVPPVPVGGGDVKHEGMLNQELESVDFYIAQGYLDIARDTLDMLERQFGTHPLIKQRRGAFGETDQPNADAAKQFTDFSEVDLSASDFSTPVEPQQGAAFFVMPEAEVAEETAEQPAAMFIQPEMPAVNGSAKSSGIDPGLAAIFDEFREAVEDDEPPTQSGDYETHFNLGIAYKEMDLVDEAVEEFQQAAAMAQPSDGTSRYFQCCNMLGHCFMQKQMHRLAIMWFKKGLETPALGEEEYQALRYEVGMAYEQMGDVDAAIEVFTEVYGVNVSYRGVADKLRELQTQRAMK
jgi:tetratricopeptide (TPR) repeat protein